MGLEHYRKLIATIVGLLFMLAYRRYGLELFGFETLIVDFIIAGGTMFFTWWLRNDPLPEAYNADVSEVYDDPYPDPEFISDEDRGREGGGSKSEDGSGSDSSKGTG